MPALLWIACLLLILLSAPAWWIFRYSPVRFRTVSRPARSYADALEKIDQLQALDDEGVKPLCRSAAHLHGKRTSQCIVMFHGYTNCPHQFHQLASEYHARGFNVLVPRLPGHGLKQLDEGLVGFELESLLGSVDSAIDIANGLGDHITVTGLSLGGTLACWLAMNRSDVDKVVAISPALGIAGMTPLRQQALGNLLTVLPNTWRWWDDERKEERDGPQNAYPRWNTRSLAILLRLGRVLQVTAQRRAPVVHDITIVRNPSDDVISLKILDGVVEAWCTHGASVTVEQLPAEWALIHDLIDPSQPEAQIERVYPRIHAAIDLADAFP